MQLGLFLFVLFWRNWKIFRPLCKFALQEGIFIFITSRISTNIRASGDCEFSIFTALKNRKEIRQPFWKFMAKFLCCDVYFWSVLCKKEFITKINHSWLHRISFRVLKQLLNIQTKPSRFFCEIFIKGCFLLKSVASLGKELELDNVAFQWKVWCKNGIGLRPAKARSKLWKIVQLIRKSDWKLAKKKYIVHLTLVIKL